MTLAGTLDYCYYLDFISTYTCATDSCVASICHHTMLPSDKALLLRGQCFPASRNGYRAVDSGKCRYASHLVIIFFCDEYLLACYDFVNGHVVIYTYLAYDNYSGGTFPASVTPRWPHHFLHSALLTVRPT